MDTNTIASLVAQWQYGTCVIENDDTYMEVVTLYDHDYECHILFREYDRASHKSGYSLWFLGVHIDASFVKRWDCSHPPFVQSASIVEDWYETVASLRDGE